MEPTALQTTWFLLVGVLVIGYAILDGFDLGVGVLSLFRRDATERRILVNAIGPVWDGNEVWLLTAGGALFAAFPPVYATVFSGFYLALMLLLVGLIARAVSIEFRHQVDSDGWRRLWDLMFGLGSLLPALLLGVALGNVMQGIPLDADGNFTGSFFTLLRPFPLVVGVLGLVMFVAHGALYAAMKTEGSFEADLRAWATRAWMAWVALYVVATLAAFFLAPHLFTDVLRNPITWVLFAVVLAGLALLPVALSAGRIGRAFLASSAAIAATIGLVAVSLFPRIVIATDPARNLTVAAHSSSPRTLTTMLVIALIGMPLVIGYTIFVYRIFKGKVVITKDSY